MATNDVGAAEAAWIAGLPRTINDFLRRWHLTPAGWTLGRVLQNCLWDIEDGATALAPCQITMARAMLKR